MLKKPKGQSRMDNPEKLAILGIPDKRRRQKQAKYTTQYVLDTTIHKTQDDDKKYTTQYVLDTTISK